MVSSGHSSCIGSVGKLVITGGRLVSSFINKVAIAAKANMEAPILFELVLSANIRTMCLLCSDFSMFIIRVLLKACCK